MFTKLNWTKYKTHKCALKFSLTSLFLLLTESNYQESQWTLFSKLSLEANHLSLSPASTLFDTTTISHLDDCNTSLNSFPDFILAPHQKLLATSNLDDLSKHQSMSPLAQNLPMAPTSFRIKLESHKKGYMIMSPQSLTSLTSFSLFLFNSSHTDTLSYLQHSKNTVAYGSCIFFVSCLECSPAKCPHGPFPPLLHVLPQPGLLWLPFSFKLQLP